MNDFLNSEQKIIYTEKRVNNFLNNVEQKIILCKMLEIVYAENSEQFLWENNEQFYLMQKIDFMNTVSKFEYIVIMIVENKFYQCRNIYSIIVKFKHEKHSDLAFKFSKHDFTRCFMRKQWTILINVEIKFIFRN